MFVIFILLSETVNGLIVAWNGISLVKKNVLFVYLLFRTGTFRTFLEVSIINVEIEEV